MLDQNDNDNDRFLNESPVSVVDKLIAVTFFYVGFLIICIEVVFYLSITSFTNFGSIGFFFWPSEIWFVGLGLAIFAFYILLGTNFVDNKIAPISLIFSVFLTSTLVGYHNSNDYVLQDVREFLVPMLCTPAVLLLSKWIDWTKFSYFILVVSTFIISFVFCVELGFPSSLKFNFRLLSDALSYFLILPLALSILFVRFISKIYVGLLCLFITVMMFNFSKVTLVLLTATVALSILLQLRFVQAGFQKRIYPYKNSLSFFIIIAFFAIAALFYNDQLNNGAVSAAFEDDFIKRRLTADGSLYFGDLSGGRIDMWVASIKLWTEKPILGHGFGRTVEFFSAGWKEKNQVHNYPLQLLQNTGGLGLFVLGFSWYFLFKSMLSSVLNEGSNELQLLCFAMCIYVFITFIFGLFGHPFSFPPLALLFWLCVCVCGQKLPSK